MPSQHQDKSGKEGVLSDTDLGKIAAKIFAEPRDPFAPEVLESKMARHVTIMHKLGFPLPAWDESSARLLNSGAILSDSNAQIELKDAAKRGVARRPTRSSRTLDLEELEIETYSAPGFYHLLGNRPCQDAITISRSNKAVIVAMCDGVSGCPYSELGANFLSQKAISEAERAISQLAAGDTMLKPWFAGSIHHSIVKELFEVCERLNVHPQDGASLFFGSTLQMLIITPRERMVLSLSDGYMKEGGKLTSFVKHLPKPLVPVDESHAPSISYLLTFPQGMYEHEASNGVEALAIQARALNISHYSSAANIKELELSTDGTRYTAEYRPFFGRQKYSGCDFPLGTLLDQYSSSEVNYAVYLHHLAMMGRRHAEQTKLARPVSQPPYTWCDEMPAAIPPRDLATFQLKVLEVIKGSSPEARELMEESSLSQLPTAKLQGLLLGTDLRDNPMEDEHMRREGWKALSKIGAFAEEVLKEKFEIELSSESVPLYDDVTICRIKRGG
ncbi:MAG: protein phosphatase 2C domain-containing protein [Deltaproteobacteria bacterium]|nr:protein phosphatase 2C domain-containing protein [Deltaproteobacteria bacterium]